MTCKNRLLLVPCFLALAGLSACGDEPAATVSAEAGASGAAGDVQGGVISDEMLPLESVTSQAPPRAGEGSEDAAGEDADTETSSEDEGSEEGE